jgi:hypothetical protein
MVNLPNLFKRLEPIQVLDSKENRFVAIPIPGFKTHRIGRDRKGNPCLLISEEKSVQLQSTGILLEHIVVDYHSYCQIQKPSGKVQDGHFTVIRCISTDRALQYYFLRIMSSIIVSIGNRPSSPTLKEAISCVFRVIVNTHFGLS